VLLVCELNLFFCIIFDQNNNEPWPLILQCINIMIKRIVHIIIIMFLIPFRGEAQDTYYGPGFRTGMLANPAYAGVAGDGQLRLLYFSYFPGNSYNLNSFFMSYDTYVPLMHGGTGFYISNDALGGIINDLRSGFGYAYHLKAGKDFYINAGITSSVIIRGINTGKIILPDQIDPLGGIVLPAGESLSNLNHTVFDIGAGFLFTVRNISGGFSLTHFAEPDITGTKIYDLRLKRKYSIQLSGTFNSGINKEFTISPIASFECQGDHFIGAIGSAFRYNVFSFNSVISVNKEKNTDIQTGFSIFTGKLVVFYNYKFNIASRIGQFPFSLLHQTGVTISLNNVDKRKIIKTINFPEL
jgi:type IX secretion system PorP/SprF family membrane protein